ncbi:SWIM zinc finger family protein [Bacillus infantis]|uniref:SWIM zinc finger family protein n=1 Tax=Bacillus infantis TaxID=324767 RepID=UPI003CF4AD0A
MKLSNFKNAIDATILDRGHDYYIDGRLEHIETNAENKYFFQAEGTDIYEVWVEVEEDGEIADSECDCPYDYGPICKHQAAAFYQLAGMLDGVRTEQRAVKKTEKVPVLEDILTDLSKEELIHIIMEATFHDEGLERKLLMKYVEGDSKQELKACKKLIKDIVREYKGRGGFITSRNAGRFTVELETVLEKAGDVSDPELAADISLLLLEEAIASFQYTDDSDGDVGFLIKGTLEKIEEIAMDAAGSDQGEVVFNKLLKAANSNMFDGWDEFQIDLLQICLIFASVDIYREQLRSFIESQLRNAPDDKYSKYTKENLLQLLYRLLDQYGPAEEAMKFIQEHLHFSSFRKQLLEKYLDEHQHEKVIEVALAGEDQDRAYAGLVTKWKEYRYKAYKALGRKEEQQSLAREMFLDGDFGLYGELKELGKENERFYEELKEELKGNNRWHSERLLLQLIEKENDTEELMIFVRKNPSYIERYAGKLAKHYKEEVTGIYRAYIYNESKSASNRSQYREVCRKLNRFKKLAGKLEQAEIIETLMEDNKRKPAFLDELEKIR